MSNVVAGEPETLPNGKRKVRAGINISLAICAVVERKKLGWQVNYAAIAERFNTTVKSLKSYFARYKRNEVQLTCTPETIEASMDDKALYERMRLNIRRHTALVVSHHEAALLNAEDKTGKLTSKRKDPRREEYGTLHKDLKFFREEMRELLRLRTIIDEGYDAWLQMQLDSKRTEKNVNPTLPVPEEDQAKMLQVGTRQEALVIMREAAAKQKPIEVEAVVTPRTGE